MRGHGPGQETLQTGKRNVEITALEAVGNYAQPYAREAAGDNEFPIGPDYAHPAAPVYFNWRKASIYGGSNEIQRNIIAKMVLGL